MSDGRDRTVVAAFVSSHGFGHAARATAVLEALRRRRPDVLIELFTGTPGWFFGESLGVEGTDWRHHREVVDPGLVQQNALREDLGASLRALDGWTPPTSDRIAGLAERLSTVGARAVLCDISPLGLAAAHEAGVPSLLVESFTWDWIYEGYRDACPELAERGAALSPLFDLATRRLQTEPCCGRRPDLPVVGPISRPARESREEVRRRLGLGDDAPFVLVTMGGIEWSFGELGGGGNDEARTWLVLVGGTDRILRDGRVVRLPHRSPIHHPDLVAAADGVVAKLGYSTLAETWRAGVPIAYVPRPAFPESPVLEGWVLEHLPSLRISPESLEAGAWIDAATRLPALAPPRPPEIPDLPPEEAASVLADLLGP